MQKEKYYVLFSYTYQGALVNSTITDFETDSRIDTPAKMDAVFEQIKEYIFQQQRRRIESLAINFIVNYRNL